MAAVVGWRGQDRAVVFAFMDCAGLQQKLDRPSVHRPKIGTHVYLQHLPPSREDESDEPAVCSTRRARAKARSVPVCSPDRSCESAFVKFGRFEKRTRGATIE